MKTKVLALMLFALSSPGAHAQDKGPYADFTSRKIKALSAQQIADLKAGRGMGLALPAEMNGYPGPSHALELADKLGLSVEQRVKMSALFEAMKAEVIPIGEDLINQEAALDGLFAKRTVTPSSLAASI